MRALRSMLMVIVWSGDWLMMSLYTVNKRPSSHQSTIVGLRAVGFIALHPTTGKHLIRKPRCDELSGLNVLFHNAVYRLRGSWQTLMR